MAEKLSEKDQQLTRRQTAIASPFSMLDRFADEVDRMFSDFGLGRGWRRPGAMSQSMAWMPQVEVSQRNNEFVVRADLPGLKKEDVKVDVTDEALTIQGERRREHEEERSGVYRSERSYGSFYRTIPLPEGAITEQAKATFKDGVLEVIMPAPPEQVNRGRRLEISESGQK
ncbi:MAG TPA: Hsp20/alpha crystallin family protein [Vicinamibacterales bacterium]|jgi:HSP20 family protein|nr:Hsp20/alpha crystallin family protein [Vicinamibacterales bacterium]